MNVNGVQAMSLEENKALLRTIFEETDKRHEVPRDRFDSNHRMSFPGQPEPLDYKAHNQMAALFYAAIPDGRHVIEDLMAEGDSVVCRGVWLGTHLGEFQGIAPSGDKVALTFTLWARIRDGKMLGGRLEFNAMSLLQQIGALPAPAQSAA
jgi:predicted ester cyclase